MDWIENAYVKLSAETDFRQGMVVAFEGAWLHCLGDNGRVETFPAAHVEMVRWDPPVASPAQSSPRRIR